MVSDQRAHRDHVSCVTRPSSSAHVSVARFRFVKQFPPLQRTSKSVCSVSVWSRSRYPQKAGRALDGPTRKCSSIGLSLHHRNRQSECCYMLCGFTRRRSSHPLQSGWLVYSAAARGVGKSRSEHKEVGQGQSRCRANKIRFPTTPMPYPCSTSLCSLRSTECKALVPRTIKFLPCVFALFASNPTSVKR